MKRYPIILGLLILVAIFSSACEDTSDYRHKTAALNQQLRWETHQRKALQRYIDYVLNARYEANEFGTRRRKSWKIKDPISSADLLAILENRAPGYVPNSLEIIELSSIDPAPPVEGETYTELPISLPQNIPPPLENGTTTDTPALDSVGEEKPVGQLSDLNTETTTRRVGVSRGLPPANSGGSATVVEGPGGQEGIVQILEQQRIPIRVDEELLFESGRATINAKGRQAIGLLARQLRSYPGHLIMVEGHTDDKEVSNLGPIRDNWDLSVIRATTVVRALVEAGAPATQLVASGRGEHFPVQSNQSAEGRKANRRVEIVLTPWPIPGS